MVELSRFRLQNKSKTLFPKDKLETLPNVSITLSWSYLRILPILNSSSSQNLATDSIYVSSNVISRKQLGIPVIHDLNYHVYQLPTTRILDLELLLFTTHCTLHSRPASS